MSSIVPFTKQSAPSPISPAMAKVGGLAQASQIGGFGLENGLGSTLRLGMRKNRPSYS